MLIASIFYLGKVVIEQVKNTRSGCSKCGCDDQKGYGRKERRD